VDISARLRLQEPQAWPQVAQYWEKALGSLWFYIKDKSKEIRQNLLAGIHFPPAVRSDEDQGYPLIPILWRYLMRGTPNPNTATASPRVTKKMEVQ